MNLSWIRSRGAIIPSILCAALLASSAAGKIENTLHDLTARGPGASERRISDACAFCHIPHNANPTRALWNRDLPAVNYELYDSPTIQAELDQPTGASRMCLSCHDGTVALEETRINRRGMHIPLGRLRGRNSLDTDLSDDHPISFTYDTTLANRQGELADPRMLPSGLSLEFGTQLQCTSCHDPHEDRNPKFLVRDNSFSKLCVGCHQIPDWSTSVHANSSGTPGSRGPANPADRNPTSVAESGCGSCHRVHSAAQPRWLLDSTEEEGLCLECHRGSSDAREIDRDLNKLSAHPVYDTEGLHQPGEVLATMQRHVTCTDCHDPHAMQAAAAPSSMPPSLQGAPGVSAAGTEVGRASTEYEVCFGCHGLTEQRRTVVTRMDNIANPRLEFSPGNRSFHPVVAPARGTSLGSLESSAAGSSLIRCTDCHNSDEQDGRGPHGSVYEPILEREYRTESPTMESFQAFALCYKCHNRAAILTDEGGFPHETHLVKGESSCASCHDAHGSRNNTRLINFMLEDAIGREVVSPSSSGRLQFLDLGSSRGECYLTCHDVDHDPKTYPFSSDTIPGL